MYYLFLKRVNNETAKVKWASFNPVIKHKICWNIFVKICPKHSFAVIYTTVVTNQDFNRIPVKHLFFQTLPNIQQFLNRI